MRYRALYSIDVESLYQSNSIRDCLVRMGRFFSAVPRRVWSRAVNKRHSDFAIEGSFLRTAEMRGVSFIRFAIKVSYMGRAVSGPPEIRYLFLGNKKLLGMAQPCHPLRIIIHLYLDL